MSLEFSTKGDIINTALSNIAISGIVVPADNEDRTTALMVLESLMYELRDGRNICLNYNFEEIPDTGSDHGMRFAAFAPISAVLALRLCKHFKQAPVPTLVEEASSGSTTISTLTDQTRQVQYPRRQPRGSGNTLRYNRWQRFYRKAAQPSLSCSTIYITEGEINDYRQSWESYLRSTEDIDTYTIDITGGIRLISDSELNGIITFRIEGLTSDESNGVEQIRFIVTTTEGRKDERTIDVQVTSLP